jgi:hypothetical protein
MLQNGAAQIEETAMSCGCQFRWCALGLKVEIVILNNLSQSLKSYLVPFNLQKYFVQLNIHKYYKFL